MVQNISTLAALVCSCDWNLSGGFSGNLVLWWLSLILQHHTVHIPSCVFCSQCYRKPKPREGVLVILLGRSPLPGPRWSGSFPRRPRGASYVFVLHSSQKAVVEGRAGGAAGPFSECSREECRIVPIEDPAPGSSLLDSHHGLHKYDFHLAWPLIVLYSDWKYLSHVQYFSGNKNKWDSFKKPHLNLCPCSSFLSHHVQFKVSFYRVFSFCENRIISLLIKLWIIEAVSLWKISIPHLDLAFLALSIKILSAGSHFLSAYSVQLSVTGRLTSWFCICLNAEA